MWSHEALVRFDNWGSFARNLSVVSALVALSFCLVSLSSRKSGLPLSARAGIASFGWVLIPIVTLMTFLPRTWTRVELVLVVAGLAHALILLLILAGIHWRSTRPIGVALVLTLVAAFSGVVSMIVSMVGERTHWEHTERLSNAFRWSGELAYLAVPIAIGFAIAIPWREARGKAALVLSGLAAAFVAARDGHLEARGRTEPARPSIRRRATRLLARRRLRPLRDPARGRLGCHRRSHDVEGFRSPADGSGAVVALERRLRATHAEHAVDDGLGVALLARAGLALAQRRRDR